MSDTRYNGWSNYETWCYNLWISNEESTQMYWTERAQAAYDATDEDESIKDRKDQAARDLAQEMESEMTEGIPEGVTGLYQNLLTTSLQAIDFQEVAENWIDEVETEAA